MKRRPLAIGFAVYNDPKGACFTIQHIRMSHPEVHNFISLVVVDNNPDTPEGNRVKAMCRDVREFPVTYEKFPAPVGTSAPRQRVFELADAEAVLCMDAHVFLPPGTLAKLIHYYDLNWATKNLLSGPIFYDNMIPCLMATHFDNSWGGEMWGRWSTAWRSPENNVFSIEEGNNGKTLPRYLFEEHPLSIEETQAQFPSWPWEVHHSGHQEHFLKAGYVPAAGDPEDKPFEIPAMGLGLFTCRKEAWLGFNPNFRGFGSEEWYIHEKFRQHGAKCLCLPFLRWWHYFGWEQPAYARHLTMWNKVRNYLIGHSELGLSLDRIEREFLQGNKISRLEWEILTSNPANPPETPFSVKR